MTTVRKGRRRVASTALNSDAGSANASSFMATSVASTVAAHIVGNAEAASTAAEMTCRRPDVST